MPLRAFTLSSLAGDGVPAQRRGCRGAGAAQHCWAPIRRPIMKAAWRRPAHSREEPHHSHCAEHARVVRTVSVIVTCALSAWQGLATSHWSAGGRLNFAAAWSSTTRLQVHARSMSTQGLLAEGALSDGAHYWGRRPGRASSPVTLRHGVQEATGRVQLLPAALRALSAALLADCKGRRQPQGGTQALCLKLLAHPRA